MGAEEEAWVTLATNDTYALGALVLGHSIRRAGTSRRLVALVTPGVTMAMRDQLAATFDLVEMVNVLDSGDAANLALLSRPDLGVTFTKLHCWRLTQFSKCVFLDADTLVLHACDELFDREELSAAPDAGWPDCFNSGVFVYRPSMETYERLINFAVSHGSFDGGDQGLLNSFFSDWATKDISRHLPFIYNMCSTATYSYLPAFKKFGETVRIVHFIGSTKPWMQSFDSETRLVRVGPGQEHQKLLLQIWWDIFCYCVHPNLSIDMGGLAGAFSQMTLGAPKSDHQKALEEHMRREAWEHGQADYLGQDSFENVWKKIMETMSKGTAPSSQPPPPADSPPSQPVSTPVVETPKPSESAPKPEPVEAPPAPKPEPVEAPPAPKPEPVAAPQPPSPALKAVPVPQKAPPAPKPEPVPQKAPPAPKPEPVPQKAPPAPKPEPVPQKAPPAPKPEPVPHKAPSAPKVAPAPPQPSPPSPKTAPPSQPIPPPQVAPAPTMAAAPTTPPAAPEKKSAPQKSSPQSPVSPPQPAAPPPTPVKTTAPVSMSAASAAPASPTSAKVSPLETKEPAAAKAAPPKSSSGPSQEAAAQAQAPVAPKRKGGAAAQPASGRGKSTGTKGKK